MLGGRAAVSWLLCDREPTCSPERVGAAAIDVTVPTGDGDFATAVK